MESLTPALVGALTSLFIVWATMSMQRKQQKETYRHQEQIEKDKQNHQATLQQRKYSLDYRKEVYLNAVNELASASAFLAKCADLNFPDKDLGITLSGYGGALAKIHLVASLETIKKNVVANAYFLESTYEMMGLRIRLRQLQHGASEHNELIKTLTNQNTQIIMAAAQMGAGFNQQQFITNNQRVEQSHNELNNLNQKIIEMQTKLAIQSVEKAAHYGLLLVEANIALRGEVGLSFGEGEQEYRQVMKDNAGHLTKTFNNWLSSMAGN